MSKFKTPREKKLASLALDRRNVYGENDKASRKSIPNGKRRGRKAIRRAAKESLHSVSSTMHEDEIVQLESLAKSREFKSKRGAFRKQPDASLGSLLAAKQSGDWRLTRRPGK